MKYSDLYLVTTVLMAFLQAEKDGSFIAFEQPGRAGENLPCLCCRKETKNTDIIALILESFHPPACALLSKISEHFKEAKIP